MEFQQLEMFAAVVEEGSVRRAAERVFRTAPAVSIALRKLEEELGAPLFDRSERNHRQLTPAGRSLYSYATRILDMRKEATAAIKELSLDEHPSLRIGTLESTSLYLLPRLIQTFNLVHPATRTEVVCGNSERLLTALANRTIELALVVDVANESQFDGHLIVKDELVLITSPEHSLAQLKKVQVSHLAGEHLIVQGAKSVLRERIVQAFQDAETAFTVSVENIAIEAIKRMVAENLGVGFVPLMCVREEVALGKLATIEVEGINREWDLWLVWLKDRALSEVAHAFVDASLSAAKYLENPKLSVGGKEARTDNPQAIVMKPSREIRC
ncbi:MAG TPA: LysR family transcriptional regulator [Pyrinomonadaceae bacterium]|nr:LysR family transcriptional regulator [Pyrinomonadaceae bacterium]